MRLWGQALFYFEELTKLMYNICGDRNLAIKSETSESKREGRLKMYGSQAKVARICGMNCLII